jgi:hypothetical protein
MGCFQSSVVNEPAIRVPYMMDKVQRVLRKNPNLSNQQAALEVARDCPDPRTAYINIRFQQYKSAGVKINKSRFSSEIEEEWGRRNAAYNPLSLGH